MKDKLYAGMQTFSRSIIKPVMFMAVAGIVIAISAVLRLDFMPLFLSDIGKFFFRMLTNGMLGNLSLIFCVGIAAAMAKEKISDAAILAVSVFIIFLYANNFWLQQNGMLAEAGKFGLAGTGQAMVLGVQVTDMGVFLGIILGCITGYVHNKLYKVKFPKYLSPYEGTKFAFLVLIAVVAILAILVTYIWPPVDYAIEQTVIWMAKEGPIGYFMYGFLNRLLLPFGLHHFLWMPLYYTALGGTAEIAGTTYYGGMNIWFAEIGNIANITTLHPSIGYLMNFGYTALPAGIALALIHTADKNKRKEVTGTLIPAVVASFLAGITEPIEFIFLFTSPILWLVHAVIYGFGLWLASIVGLQTFVGNLVETILYSLAVPVEMGRQWLIPILFVVLTAIEYIAFKFLIVTLHLHTLGRSEACLDGSSDDVATADELSTVVNDGDAVYKKFDVLLEGLGGKDNIESINNCITRLRIGVKDDSLVKKELLDKYPANGNIVKPKHIQVIIGLGVEDVKDAFKDYLKKL